MGNKNAHLLAGCVATLVGLTGCATGRSLVEDEVAESSSRASSAAVAAMTSDTPDAIRFRALEKTGLRQTAGELPAPGTDEVHTGSARGEVTLDSTSDRMSMEGMHGEQQSLPPAEVAPLPQAEFAGIPLEHMQALALANNPTLVQAHMQVLGMAGRARQAGLYPNPTVGYVQEQIGVEGTAGEFVGGFVEQELVTANKLELSRSKYRLRQRAAQHQAFAQRMRVANDVRIHFGKTLGAARVVDVHRELLETAEDRLVTTRELFNVGQATEVDLHLATAALKRAELDLKMTANALHAEWVMLTAVVGVEMPFEHLAGTLGENCPFVEWEEARCRLLAESPELAMARDKLSSDRVTVARERAEPVPNVFVRGSAGQNFEANQGVGGAEVFIELPLYDRNQGTIQQAEADVRRQWNEIRRVELDLQRRLAEQYKQYLTAYQHVRDYEEVVLPEAREAYRKRLVAYKEDREEWTAVLDTQEKLFDLQIEFVQRQVELRTAETLVCGLLLHGALDAPPGVTPPGHIDSVPKPR